MAKLQLPIVPPFPPMEAESVAAIPVGPKWQYEPKWDGFRCIAFRDGDEIYLQSRNCKPLGRYFPEVVDGLRQVRAQAFVLDGELVVPVDRRLSFEQLQLRLHPAASRVRKLADEHPALLLVFDILVTERRTPLVDTPLANRRERLERFASRYLQENDRIRLSPAKRSRADAEKWFRETSGELDGIIAKRLDAPYESGGRDSVVKVKNIRSADCVVGGFRYATSGDYAGSLLLGMYDSSGLLDHVGYLSGLGRQQLKQLTPKLESMHARRAAEKGFTGRAPGGPSRWSTERSGEYVALPHELVVEVAYDHVTGDRFRHGTSFLRWRPDKNPRQCRLEQIQPSAGAARLLQKLA